MLTFGDKPCIVLLMKNPEKEMQKIISEFLIESNLRNDEDSLDCQIEDLTKLSGCLYEIAKIEGSVGYRAFYNALRLSQTLNCAIDNLKRIKKLNETLDAWRK